MSSVGNWTALSASCLLTFPPWQPCPVPVSCQAPVLHMAITGSDYLNLAAAAERYLALDRDYKSNKFPEGE